MMQKKSLIQFCVFFFSLFFLAHSVYAFKFDRRTRKKAPNSYFLYPVAIKLPGVGDAAGFGGSFSEIAGSEAAATFIHLDGDFSMNLLTILDIPLYNISETARFALSPTYIDLKNIGYDAYERGRDSKKENKIRLRAHSVKINGAELSLQLFDRQLEFYYNLGSASIKPKSVIDADGNEYISRLEAIQTPTVYRQGIYWDDTDDRRDPRVGYRFQLERYGVTQSDVNLGDGYQNDSNLTLFIPFIQQELIWVQNFFFSESVIIRPGVVKSEDYQCPADAPPACQVLVDRLKQNRENEVKKGNATALGGVQRLRSYPQGRFYDTYTGFLGSELRWYLGERWSPFDIFIEKGVFTGWQLALFYEMGQVGPSPNNTLWEAMKTSTGFGARALFNTVVLRLDYATGAEGKEVTFFVGYPF